MKIENAFSQLCKLLIKAKVSYRMTQSLTLNCKALKGDLDSQQDLIKEDHILINGMLTSKYQNCNKMIGWYI